MKTLRLDRDEKLVLISKVDELNTENEVETDISENEESEPMKELGRLLPRKIATDKDHIRAFNAVRGRIFHRSYNDRIMSSKLYSNCFLYFMLRDPHHPIP